MQRDAAYGSLFRVANERGMKPLGVVELFQEAANWQLCCEQVSVISTFNEF